MIIDILSIVDSVLFFLLAFSVIYLFIFALASLKKRKDIYPPAKTENRFAVLFPAYKEDKVIINSVKSFLNQDYNKEKLDVVVISDKMTAETNKLLAALPIKLLEIQAEQSSKAKALNFAIDQLDSLKYDIVVIMDGDNIAEPDFLARINDAYDCGAKAIQAHRVAKNQNTATAILDAASEEINNSFFRKGQVRFGLSSALSGSGMAFDYDWFAKNIKQVSSSGEDKELERLLLRQGIYIEYLEDVIVYDEKTQNSSSFYNQRRRWLAAQYSILIRSLKDLPKAIFSGNADYCNKILQWMMLPRVLLLGLIGLIAIATLFIAWQWAIKWWCLLFLFVLTFAIAIPDELVDKRLNKALIKIPFLFILMVLNLFRLKGANKKFDHTEHTH